MTKRQQSIDASTVADFEIGDRVRFSYDGKEGVVEEECIPHSCFRVKMDDGSYRHTIEGTAYRIKPLPVGPNERFPKESPRAALLDEAKALVTGPRNNQYGPPTQDFKRSADALTAMGYRKTTATGDVVALESHDIAVLLAMVKISRITWTPSKRDSWTDLAGYAACGFECSLVEDGEA